MSKIRGVNLGNWLVLEKWMKPELFDGLKAEDETSFCEELGENALERLKKHRDTFITFEDFKWISNAGLNAVRIPIPHWIFGDTKPYYGCIEYLDNAMEWAEKTNLNVLIDLHTAPGCQNGFDNGGILGVCKWHTKEEYVSRTVNIIEKIAKRYKENPALWGIQLLNEPRWDVPMDILRNYYLKGYEVCRRHIDENIAIVFHDGFRLTEWKDFMQTSEYKNVILDTHFYQCFAEDQKKLDMSGHLQLALSQRSKEINEMSKYFKVIIGEWSLGIDTSNNTLKDMNELQIDAASRAYAAAQLLSYETAEGWFFWSYKLENENMLTWNYRKSVEKGWFPSKLK
ncbi:glucan 1,3-beta-glucosidase [Clostridium sp. USBA 49]|uniref:glycoside hydrolase family 5 protein n=1 Tax=Clostridium sp. USBA 49 TaxID=1881060 RepID=UPI00099AA6FC|nr:cellulase family glycosylhydrolase [Clostridium sp. USBA 49]SKA87861.1 glucan 1,3-beta-glucosidase [Clostridium sp. USBA 49]